MKFFSTLNGKEGRRDVKKWQEMFYTKNMTYIFKKKKVDEGEENCKENVQWMRMRDGHMKEYDTYVNRRFAGKLHWKRIFCICTCGFHCLYSGPHVGINQRKIQSTTAFLFCGICSTKPQCAGTKIPNLNKWTEWKAEDVVLI